MARAESILERLVTSLKLSDPEWDVAVGTPEFKILEAVALELERVSSNNVLNDFHLDVDSKSGIELDIFVEMFGISRIMGRRATGTLLFRREEPADQDFSIPMGTQAVKPATSVSPSIYFQTIAPAILEEGQTEVEVPIEAVVSGVSGNVVTGAISLIASAVTGVTSIVNPGPTTGGRNVETDVELRQRWRATVFRNVAGTEGALLGLCLEHPSVSRAIVIGPVLRKREQLEIVGGRVTSTVTDSKFTYPPGGEAFGTDIGTSDEILGIPTIDYALITNTPAEIDILNSSRFPNGMLVELEHEYLPEASRNDPSNGVYHKVDLFVSGQESRYVTDQTKMKRDASNLFSSDVNHPLYRGNWIRDDGVTLPSTGNPFTRLHKTPLLELPPKITVGGVTFNRGTNYWAIRETSTNKNSVRALDGIEWSAGSSPSDGVSLNIEYFYNGLIEELDEAVQSLRLVGMDTLVHRAEYVNVKFNLAIVYDLGTSPTSVLAEVEESISKWLSSKGFHEDVQIADLIDVIKDVDAVDNVRLLRSTEDATNYGIQLLANDGSVLSSHTSDVYLKSEQVPVLHSVHAITRAQNTF